MHKPVLRINTTEPAHHERNFLTAHYSLASPERVRYRGGIGVVRAPCIGAPCSAKR
jgi:hypothetical protein